MQFIDTHHHLWDLENNSYPWLKRDIGHFAGDYSKIRRSYLISHFLADAATLPKDWILVKSVHVQAEWDHENDPVGETAWLQKTADSPGSKGKPSGIVAFADLADPLVEDTLERHAKHKNWRGIRHMLNHSQDNPRLNFTPRSDLMMDKQWRAGYRLLAKFNGSFDLQIWPWQLEMAAKLTGDIPEVRVVLNHTGLPYASDAAAMRQWRDGMKALAARPHVSAKISALGMAHRGWTIDSIRPLVEETIAIFGADRCMFASNFPVDSITSSYAQIWHAYDEITSRLPAPGRQKLFHDNAVKYYRL